MAENETKKSSKLPIIIGAAAAVVVIGVVLAIVFSNKTIRATTMRMLRMEGTVILEENGKLKEVREDLRLKSGNAVSTEDESLCSIGLDETKIVTLDENSRAEFTKKGKALNLNLTQGSLFFEVSKKLASDESFEIETTTMIVGIRGTSGLVTCDTQGNDEVICTDGTIHLTARHPVTGEIKEIDVPAGSKVTVYIYDREVDGVMFEVEPLTEEDLPDFVTDRLVENMVLLDKVVSDTGWSKPLILGEDVTVSVKKEEEDEETPAETLEEDKEPEEEIEEPEEEEIVETPPQNTLPEGVTKNADGTYTLADGSIFDPNFYRNQYSDLAGMTDEELLNHYLTHGKSEERSANQAEQDQKDAEEAAKKALEEAQNHSDDDDDDSSSSSGGNNNNSSSGTQTYTLTGEVVRDGDGNAICGWEDGHVALTENNLTIPMVVNLGDSEQEIKASKLSLPNTATVDKTVTVGTNGTTIKKTANGYHVTWTEGGQTFEFEADNNDYWGQEGLHDNLGNEYSGIELYHTDPTAAGQGATQYCIVTDNGEVILYNY